MQKRTSVPWVATVLTLVGMTGCPDIKLDPGEGVGDTPAAIPTVEFDPVHSIVPFPNNLVRNPMTGKVTLPPQPCESATSKAVREGVLNTLDGFGTYEAGLQFTLTVAPDPASVASHVKLFKRDASGTTEVTGLVVKQGVSVRFADPTNCAAPSLIPAVTIISPIPLHQNTTYTVAVLDGITTTTGEPFQPSGTWLIVRSMTPPVVFGMGDQADVVLENNTPLDPRDDAQRAQLHAIAGLWQGLKAGVDAIVQAGNPRDKILLAWDFTTQTVTDPLDPAVAGSVASTVPATGFQGLVSVAGGDANAFLSDPSRLGAQACALAGCTNLKDIIGGQFSSTQYQTPTPNPLGPTGAPVPGPWNDPIHPTVPPVELNGTLQAIIGLPAGPTPPNGWPTVIFGHGLGSSKESLAAIAPQLAGAGFASIAIDFVDHGSRAIRTSNAAALGCADVPASTRPDHGPDPTAFPQCYALFLSTDLAGTRDNFRQTVLDLHRVAKVISTCGTGTGCVVNGAGASPFKVDPTKIVYAGISLGGIIGSTFTSVNSTVKASGLNVPGVGLLDILENTETVQIRCSLVNALIDAGILMGAKWTGGTTGLCVEQDQGWKTQPGYQQFSGIARWVLDPADGANFTPMLAAKRILIQEVIGDQVVPNIATENEGKLVGLTPMTAAPAVCAMADFPACTATIKTQPSPAIVTAPMTNKWLQYPPVPAAGGNFGNTFAHASLLRPANAAPDGLLGTVRLQTDLITFLVLNR